MATYRVEWISVCLNWNWVEADSEKEAIKKAKKGHFCSHGERVELKEAGFMAVRDDDKDDEDD